VNTPAFTAHLAAEERFDVSGSAGVKGFVGADVSYVGDRLGAFLGDRNRELFPAYTKTNLHFGVERQTWRVDVFVNNVADVRGVLQGGKGQFIPYAYTFTQPRTLGVNISTTF